MFFGSVCMEYLIQALNGVLFLLCIEILYVVLRVWTLLFGEYRENGVAYSMFRSSKVCLCVEIHQMFLNDPPYSLVCVCANSFVHSVSNVQ